METYTLPASTSKAFGQLTGELQEQVEMIFKRYDIDMDGGLTIDELRIMMADLGGVFGFTEEADTSTLMALLDVDGNERIDWQEWSHACAVWLTDMNS